MTLFQAVIYSIVLSITSTLPLSMEAHSILLADLTQWPAPDSTTLGPIFFGSLLALFFFYLHDWASLTSSFLSVLIYRKKPMTLDERLPFFLLLTAIPVCVTLQLGLHESLDSRLFQPQVVGLLLAGLAALLMFGETFGRKNKGMFDWTIFEAILIGLGQLLAVLPGGGRMLGALAVTQLRNFNREAAVKYSLMSGLPYSLYWTITHLSQVSISSQDWMQLVQLAATTLVSMVATLLSLSTFSKNFTKHGGKGPALYRVLLGLGAAVLIWFQTR
jgi:undecaprenyl-diphosphatase